MFGRFICFFLFVIVSWSESLSGASRSMEMPVTWERRLFEALEATRNQNFPHSENWSPQEIRSQFYAGWAQSPQLSRALSWPPEEWARLKQGEAKLNARQWQQVLNLTEHVRAQIVQQELARLKQHAPPRVTPSRVFYREMFKGLISLQVAFLGGVLLGTGYIDGQSSLQALVSTLSVFASVYTVTRPLKTILEISKIEARNLAHQEHLSQVLTTSGDLKVLPQELVNIHFLRFLALVHPAVLCEEVLDSKP